jgi:hypothetical protein
MKLFHKTFRLVVDAVMIFFFVGALWNVWALTHPSEFVPSGPNDVGSLQITVKSIEAINSTGYEIRAEELPTKFALATISPTFNQVKSQVKAGDTVTLIIKKELIDRLPALGSATLLAYGISLKDGTVIFDNSQHLPTHPTPLSSIGLFFCGISVIPALYLVTRISRRNKPASFLTSFLVAAIAFFATIGVFLLRVYAAEPTSERLHQMPAPLELEWDISKENNVLEQDFSVSKKFDYDIFIGFACILQTAGEISEIYEFTGDGRKGPYDIHNNKWATWDEYHQADQVTKKNKYEIRYGHPGTTIPLRIKIENMDDPNKNVLVIDKTFNTVGISRSLIEIPRVHREVGSVELSPGKYKLTAITMQKTSLPSVVTKTFLEILSPDDVRAPSSYPPNNDN